LRRWLHRDRTVLGVLVSGALVLGTYLAGASLPGSLPAGADVERLLTAQPWVCEVVDPTGADLVSTSVESFARNGRFAGHTRLEDRTDGRLLLEFRYEGVWQFEDPWLTEAIHDYRYLHVDESAFSREQLSVIEAEFAEPEVSRLHALSERQLVYGAERALYQCHGRENAPTSST
jgi:hypothetical protein